MKETLLATSAITILGCLLNISPISVAEAKFPCAPAQHCDPRSQLCRSSEYVQAMIRGEPLPKETFETSRGICTDAYKWKCNKDGTKCKSLPYSDNELKERCKVILYTDQSDRDRFPANAFVEACQSGMYTCTNGDCSSTVTGCGGADKVRYDKTRCPKDTCGADDILTNNCAFNEKTWIVNDNKECSGDMSITRPACCAKSPTRECEYIFFQKDTIDIPDEICGTVCIPPKCEDDDGGGTGTGETDAPTKTPTTSAPTTKRPTPKTGTLQPTSNPTSSEITTYGVTGFELSFNFASSNADCCCKLSCDCFGDPHCTDYFGHQVTSKLSTGSFRMYEAGDFLFRVHLGDPQGIIQQAEVTVNGYNTKFSLSINDCQNTTHNWRNLATGKFLSADQIPSNWEAHYTFGNIYSDPNTFYVRDMVAQVAVELKCVAFFIQEGGVTVQRNRLDIHVTKWNDLIGACCPTTGQNKDWFKQNNAAGFCVGNEKIPGSFDTNNPRGRRLQSDDSGDDLTIDDGSSTTDDDGTILVSDPHAKNDNSTIDSDLAQQLCEKYFAAVKASGAASIPIPALSTMEACIQNVMDFGLEALQKLIDALKNAAPSCVSDPNSPELMKPLAECQQGIVLEARAPGSADWFPIRYLPADLKYCTKSLVFDFSRTGYGIDASYEYRVKRCQPDINRCGSCDAISKVTDIKLKWLYECLSYDTLKENAKEELIAAVKNGEISCGFSYRGNNDPIACLKDVFPELFGTDDKPTQKPTTAKPTTVKPTKRPVTKSPTKKPLTKSPTVKFG